MPAAASQRRPEEWPAEGGRRHGDCAIVRPLAFNTFNLGVALTRLYCAYDIQRDFVLKCEEVFEPVIVTFSPQVYTRFRLDQLGADSDALTGLANASIQCRLRKNL